MKLLRAGVLVGVALLAYAAHAQELALQGRTVESIRVVDSSTGRELAKPLPKLPLEPGKPFDIAEERESLRELYRMGDFADIRAQAEEGPGGLRIAFLVQRNFYNGIVRVEGLRPPPNESLALAALRLPLGEPFRKSALDESLARLRNTLRDDGFYQAKLEPQLHPHEDTRQMDLTVRVTPGPRARMGKIVFQNQTTIPTEELLDKSKLESGDAITFNRLERSTDRLRKYLVGKEHLSARAVLRRGDYDAQTNSVPLTLEVTAGPRVRAVVTGAKFSGSKLKKLLPMYAEGAVDEDLLEEGRRNLRDSLQRDGYFDATVDYATTPADEKTGEEVITYTINRGPKHRVEGVAFDGNHYFGSELLEERIAIQAKSFASPGRFSQQLLQGDVDSIRALYVNNGFEQAQVTPEVKDDHSGKIGKTVVRFHIVEGAQTRVAELHLEGNGAIGDNELLSVVGSTAGQPYSDANVASDRDNILAVYFNRGFPAATFESEATPAAAPNRMMLVYHIHEGTPVRVSRVLLTGNEYTRRGIIQRQIAVGEGQPLREGDVIETQQRLYNMGIFSRVGVAQQNPEGTDPDKAVVVQVEEGARYTVAYGGGFEVQRLGGSGSNPGQGILSASPRGIFEISRANVGGRDQTVSFKIRASTLQYRALAAYDVPDFFAKRKFALQFTLFADKTRDIQTFTSTRYESSLQLSQELTPTSSLIYRYFYRHVLVDASSLKINPEQIPLLSQPTRVSGFGVTYLRDRRDSPSDASRGNLNSIDVSVADTGLGSSADFVRLFFQNSTFYHLSKSFVFARSVRFGIEEPFAKTGALNIPLPERFFAGGGQSLRGFGLNQAGPRDTTTGFPIGGLASLVFNQEVRFPMRLPYLGNRVGGAIFYDAGNVFSDVNHVTLRWTPATPKDLEYFSHTVGFGFRYATPIGPVRLDLGYQLNPAQFSFFNTTTNKQQLSRLPHFQFFFNIGSIF